MKRLALLLLLASCNPSGEATPDASASPQASAEPAPLAAAPPTIASAAAVSLLPEGGPPPTPLKPDERLSADASVREREGLVGWTLSAVFRPGDVVVPPRAPEVNASGIDAARKKTELRLAIDLGPARMRVALGGTGFVLPPSTEIRARADRYGHVVVWPGGTTYRTLPPGAMRALLGERRFDVAPIGPADVAPSNEQGKRIGIRTRKVEVATRAAKATFEIGKQEGLGEGGILLCRLLLDLMNAPPQTNACLLDELPMRAELRWTGHGSFAFEVTGILKKNDMPPAALLVPPAGASFVATAPLARAELELTQQELAALRTGPIDVPTTPTVNTPPEGLAATNQTLQLRMLFVDGVSVAWLGPGEHLLVPGLPRGRYVIQWRTFFGDALEAPQTVVVPGTTGLGVPDAGAR